VKGTAKYRATDDKDGAPHVPPSKAFAHYAEWYAPDSMEDLRFRFTSKLREAMRRWRIRLENELRASGQTRARWEVMLVITLSGGRSTQKALATRLRIEGPTLVRLLDKLERDGLIQRVRGTDRRSKTIQPTAKGAAFVEQMIARTDQMRREMLDGWSVEEIDAGIALFDRLIDGMRSQVGDL